MELMIVLLLIGLLAAIATPVLTGSVNRAKESTLKETLLVVRKALDSYYADKGKYPQDLSVLVENKYLRAVPVDPVTDSKDSWTYERNDDENGEGGIRDLRSGSDKTSSNGNPYSEW